MLYPAGDVYLDHCGATLCSRWQLQTATAAMLSQVWGNPHTEGPASRRTSATVARVRELVLEHFHTTRQHYEVVFTSGATGALKLLAEVRPHVATVLITRPVPGTWCLTLLCDAVLPLSEWLRVCVWLRQPHQCAWAAGDCVRQRCYVQGGQGERVVPNP